MSRFVLVLWVVFMIVSFSSVAARGGPLTEMSGVTLGPLDIVVKFVGHSCGPGHDISVAPSMPHYTSSSLLHSQKIGSTVSSRNVREHLGQCYSYP